MSDTKEQAVEVVEQLPPNTIRIDDPNLLKFAVAVQNDIRSLNKSLHEQKKLTSLLGVTAAASALLSLAVLILN